MQLQDFSSSSSVTGPLGLSYCCGPTSVCILPMSLLQRLPEHTSPSGRKSPRLRLGCPGGLVLGYGWNAQTHQVVSRTSVTQTGVELVMAGAHETAPGGALPSVRGGRSLCLRKEASVGAPAFAHHSVMALCFCGGPGFFHKHFHLWSSSSPSPQAVVPSLGLCSHPHGPASIPDLHSWTHVSGWGTRGCGMNRLCRCHSVLPVPKARPLSPLISLLVRGLPQMQEPLLTFSSSPGVPVPSNFLSSFSFLYTLVLPSSVGIFLVLLGVRGPLLVFNGCPVELFHLYMYS